MSEEIWNLVDDCQGSILHFKKIGKQETFESIKSGV